MNTITSLWLVNSFSLEGGMEGGWREDGGRMEGGGREDGGRMEGGMEGGWREDGGRMEGGMEGGWRDSLTLPYNNSLQI